MFSHFLCNPPKFHNTPSHRLKNLLEFVGTYEGGIFLPFVAADFFRGGVSLFRGSRQNVSIRILLFFVCLASTESTVYFRGNRLFELPPPQKVSAVRRHADSIPIYFRLHLRPLNFKESDEIVEKITRHEKRA